MSDMSHVNNKKTSFKVRVDIEQCGTTLNLLKIFLQKFPASVECFQEKLLATNCLNILVQLAKKIYVFAFTCT